MRVVGKEGAFGAGGLIYTYSTTASTIRLQQLTSNDEMHQV